MWRLLSITITLLAMANNRQLLAWNDLGHQVVARIAYDRLSDTERHAVVSILRYHPHLRNLLLKDRPHQVAEEEWIFLRAATWPDHVRPPRGTTHEPVGSHSIYQYHHANWHYVNFEYRAGQRSGIMPQQPMVHPHGTHPEAQTNILEQLDRSYLIVRGAENERSEPEAGLHRDEVRAVRLCWLMHLIGDIHQPLHVTALVDPKVQELVHGDEGGNKLAVRTSPTSSPKKLHAVWDDLLGTNSHFDKVVQMAEMLSRDPQLSSSRLPEYSQHRMAHEFAAESYQIAKDYIYLNGQINFALWSRVENHQVHEGDVPTLSPQALEQARSIAARRVTLAGYRLADRLKFIVSKTYRPTTGPIDVASPPTPIRSNRPQLVR